MQGDVITVPGLSHETHVYNVLSLTSFQSMLPLRRSVNIAMPPPTGVAPLSMSLDVVFLTQPN